MSLSVGIVGLPNAGKSTLFNALLSRQIAQVANYPFTTIEPHEGVVALPDERLEKLSEMIKPEKTTPATVTFIDIAGLVRDAHKGEGLGNQFLAKIREVDAIVHIVRAFENPDVPHYYQTLDPKRDMEIVNLELELAGIKKPVIYVLNTSEKQLKEESQSELMTQTDAIAEFCVKPIIICAKLEMELAELEPSERKEYLSELGIKESGLEKLIKEAYKILGFLSFYTIKGGKEVRSWSLKSGSTALEAAGVVHTDFAQNFIKAEVISFDELVKAGSWNKAGELGKIRLEGKDYVVQDGDVIEFKTGV
ncbi:MAG: redox-regulated ATPase YchF [Patescibacteria group bacterium]